jgi:c-di-GMP-binding flagellar brake protein YcgR
MGRSQQQKSPGFMARLFGGKAPAPVEPDAVNLETLVRLNELCEKHTFVDVRFLGREDVAYQSLIIDVDVKSQSLRIDELYPLDPGIAILVGEEIEITSRGKGLPVTFISSIIALEIHQNNPAYRVALPAAVSANQRRGFFRIDVSREMDIRLHTPLQGGSLVLCNILNISSAGVGFKIDRDISEQIRSSRMITGARLTLPDNITMYCDLEVRSYDFKEAPDSYTLVGAKLDNLSPGEKKLFDRCLLKLQRDTKRSDSEWEDL